MTLACVDVGRLTAELQNVEETADGIAVTVKVSNVGDPQELASVEQGVFAIDTTGGAWQAADACSTLIGQTVHEGQPVTGTVCFPFQRVADGYEEMGELGPYIPPGTQLAYLLLTDDIFVSDQNRYYLQPITLGAAASTSAPTTPDTATPVPAYPDTVTVDVTVWQHIPTGNLYLSTRPQGKGWTTHNTPLDMSQVAPSGQFYQGSAITVEIPVEPSE